MKKQERKENYVEIMKLMAQQKHKEAYEKLVCMCGSDTGLFLIASYEDVIEANKDKG